MSWQPSLGAWLDGGGVRFRVWAPLAERVVLVVEPRDGERIERLCEPRARDMFEAHVPKLAAGSRYRYRLDDQPPFPDPASRYQPEGVHGPSAVVDPGAFAWTDGAWRGLPREDLVVYELHVGTFTPEGTFASAARRLSELVDLGVTAIELMPLADFPGNRSWGYDGAALFAPARCYGAPDDLRALVDEAHRVGLAVLLDVVHNHLGPDGAYARAFSPYYFRSDRRTPWGDAVNLDGPHSEQVREFFIENALHWVHEYHVDGLRLDATHALEDASPRHFLSELTERVKASVSGRTVLVVAEDDRNLANLVRARDQGGFGLDAVWADDFHHQVRCHTTGDRDGYFRDFTGSARDLATTILRGWFFCGQFSGYQGRPRGTAPGDLDYDRFVVALQTHDQVGNRAHGERLHQQVDAPTWRALTALLACVPETPLLFMGQEWAATAPFLYFTDHHEELGRLVTEGRRREFSTFLAFQDPESRARIPDPQALETFLRSRLAWEERAQEPHASALRCTRAVLALRLREPALRVRRRGATRACAAGDEFLLLRRDGDAGESLLVVVCLGGSGTLTLAGLEPAALPASQRWEPIFTSEDDAITADPAPPSMLEADGTLRLSFARPSAVVLRAVSRGGVS